LRAPTNKDECPIDARRESVAHLCFRAAAPIQSRSKKLFCSKNLRVAAVGAAAALAKLRSRRLCKRRPTIAGAVGSHHLRTSHRVSARSALAA